MVRATSVWLRLIGMAEIKECSHCLRELSSSKPEIILMVFVLGFNSFELLSYFVLPTTGVGGGGGVAKTDT